MIPNDVLYLLTGFLDCKTLQSLGEVSKECKDIVKTEKEVRNQKMVELIQYNINLFIIDFARSGIRYSD
jgi:hypothetical protein